MYWINLVVGLFVITGFVLFYLYYRYSLKRPYTSIDIYSDYFIYNSTRIEYRDIKFVSLEITYSDVFVVNFDGCLNIEYTLEGLDKKLSVPICLKLSNIGLRGYSNGINKENVNTILNNIPAEKKGKNISEFATRGEIEMSSVSNYAGFKFVDAKLSFWEKI